MTDRTKQYKALTILFKILSILLNVGPLAVYTIIALCESNLVVEKVGLVSTVFVVLVLTAIAFVQKVPMRSRIWIILIGLYLCLDSIMAPILIIGITQIVDEWIVCPFHKRFKEKLIINKEIDKRG